MKKEFSFDGIMERVIEESSWEDMIDFSEMRDEVIQEVANKLEVFYNSIDFNSFKCMLNKELKVKI